MSDIKTYQDYLDAIKQLSEKLEIKDEDILSEEAFAELSEEDLAELKSNIVKLSEEEELDETAAADSLATHGTVTSKSEAMERLMGAFGDSSEWVDKFKAAMNIFGSGKDHGVGDKSASNKATIDTKLGKGPKTKDPMPKLAKEDMDTIFGESDLTEEFKEKASTLFEAALNARLHVEVAKLEEAYEEALNEEIESFTKDLVDKIDTYLDYVVENWMKENEVAIESTLRNEITEEFISGLKTLFEENFITVPEEKVDVVEMLAAKVEELEARLDEELTEKAKLEELAIKDAVEEVFDTVSEGLTLTDKEKFKTLAEGLEFDGDLDVLTKKLNIIKENYFTKKNIKESNILEESFEGETNTDEVSSDPSINRYVQAITRTVKK